MLHNIGKWVGGVAACALLEFAIVGAIQLSHPHFHDPCGLTPVGWLFVGPLFAIVTGIRIVLQYNYKLHWSYPLVPIFIVLVLTPNLITCYALATTTCVIAAACLIVIPAWDVRCWLTRILHENAKNRGIYLE